MEFLKTLFDNGALTWEQFSQSVTEKGYKLADLAAGNYVSRRKYEDDINSKDTTIQELNGQITQRDTDLLELQHQLETSGTDNKTKLGELTAQITKLQSDYATVKTEYEEKLNKQAYEFAVRDFANTKKFTSNAAKRDFISEMLKENLKVKDNNIIGADDFVKAYTENNSDAFVGDMVKEPPTFVAGKTNTPEISKNDFESLFNFTGVRPKDVKKII